MSLFNKKFLKILLLGLMVVFSSKAGAQENRDSKANRAADSDLVELVTEGDKETCLDHASSWSLRRGDEDFSFESLSDFDIDKCRRVMSSASFSSESSGQDDQSGENKPRLEPSAAAETPAKEGDKNLRDPTSAENNKRLIRLCKRHAKNDKEWNWDQLDKELQKDCLKAGKHRYFCGRRQKNLQRL